MNINKEDFLKYFGVVEKTATREKHKTQIIRDAPSHFSVFDRRVLLSFPLTSSGAKLLNIYERPEIRLTPSDTADTVRKYESYCCTRRRGKSMKSIMKKKSKLIADYLKNVRRRLRVLYNPPKKRQGPTNRILNLNLNRYSPFYRYSFTPRERRERSRQLEFGLTRPARSLLRQIRACQVQVRRINRDVCRAYQDLCCVRLKNPFRGASKGALLNGFKPFVSLRRLSEDQLHPTPKHDDSNPRSRSSKVPITDCIDLDKEVDPASKLIVPESAASLPQFPLNHNVDLDEDEVESVPEPRPVDRTPTLSLSRLTFDQVASAMVSLDSVFQHSFLKVCLSRSQSSIKREPIEEIAVPSCALSSINHKSTEEITSLRTIKMEPTITFPPVDFSSNVPFVQPQDLPLPSAFLDPEEIILFRDGSLLDNIQDLESTENASITSSSATSAIASSDLSQRSHLRARLLRPNRSPIKDFLRSNAYRKYISSESSRKAASLPEKSSNDSLLLENASKRLPRSNTCCLKRLGLGLDAYSGIERPRTRSQKVGRTRPRRL